MNKLCREENEKKIKPLELDDETRRYKYKEINQYSTHRIIDALRNLEKEIIAGNFAVPSKPEVEEETEENTTS